MLSNDTIKLSADLGVDANEKNSTVTLYDTRAYSAKKTTVLTYDEMHSLQEWYNADLCPVCHCSINHSQVVCDTCFNEAKQYRELYGAYQE